MSDYESSAGSDSDNESNFSDDGEIKITVGIVKPIIKLTKHKNDSDSDEEESIAADSDLDEYDDVARGADERDDIDDDKVIGIENDDEEEDATLYNKHLAMNDPNLVNPSLHLEEDDDDDEEDSEMYLQKFNTQVNKNYIADFHPECLINNYEEIAALTKIIKDSGGNIIDELHRTIPFLTKYEKARILGQRTKQINTGAKAFVKVPEGVMDGYIIANLELEQKRLPFIIRRPIAGGGCEYWNLKDLENLNF